MHDTHRQTHNDIIDLGLKEISTAEDADALVNNMRGTALIFINSACGCSGRVAQPALKMAMEHELKPDMIATVFAGVDREATARVRSYFSEIPPSSPAFALLKERHLVHMIHRSDIQASRPKDVAEMLTRAFEKYCA